jgi:hypothetical protein
MERFFEADRRRGFFVKIWVKLYSSDAARGSPLKYDILYPERAFLAIAREAENPIITGL